MPKEKYSFAPEIFEHSQRIGKHYGLYDVACFQTRVHRAALGRGLEALDRRHRPRRRHEGPLRGHGAPGRRAGRSWPASRASRTSRATRFHTSRWDYDYTGGDHDGGLTKLADKRVAIIGTGATAIQCVPARRRQYAKQLYVFQRTPSSVDLRGNKPTDPEWAQAAAARLAARAARRTSTTSSSGEPFDEDLVNDGWTDIFRNLKAMAPMAAQKQAPRREAELHGRDRRLPEDEPDPRPRGRDGRATRDRRGAEALVPPVLQAADLQRRLPADLQPAERDAGGHVSERKGVERITEDRRRRQRRRVRGRLHHLRDRLRDRHRARAAGSASTSSAATVSRCSTTGRTACGPCTATPAAASPTGSTSASARTACR